MNEFDFSSKAASIEARREIKYLHERIKSNFTKWRICEALQKEDSTEKEILHELDSDQLKDLTNFAQKVKSREVSTYEEIGNDPYKLILFV